ncbi:MAG: Acidobacterial duplicated orphan permease (function unknown), partial [uncultured Gemmatimonadetes bacterium]
MDTLLQDLRYALRTLRTSPSFSLAAVLTLAVGIGAGTTVFSVINTVLLRPLPFPDAERLQLVWTRSEDAQESWLSHPEWMDLRERSSAFSDLAALRDFSFAATGGQEPEQLPALAVSSNLFSMLGVQPLLGRSFLPEEDRDGAGKTVLLSHGYWQRRFGGSPRAVGTAIMLDGEPHTVVGVLPAGFRHLPPSSVFPRDAAVLVPLEPMLGTGFLRGRDVRHLHVIGRLKPGVTAAQAQADVQGIAAQLRQEHSGTYAASSWGMTAVGYQEYVVRGVRPALLMVFGAVGFLLLLAAVNVANLLLVRHTVQAREMAVRSALGAPRSRLVRLRLFESLLLALLGGTAGVLIFEMGVQVLRAVGPANLPRLDELSLDGRVFGFAFLLAVVLAVGFGVFLAMRTPGEGEDHLLRGSSRGISSGRTHARTRRMLEVSQIALAAGLLIGTGLLLKSLS